MWSSKMAARWRRNDGNLNASNSIFPSKNNPSEPVLSRHGVEGVEMDAQSCVDHSILAIFEDSSVASESKRGVEEESETLLSALNEILDSVEYDDRTLSPFDSLPDTKLLTHTEHRDDSVELSLAERLRPRSKSPVVSVTVKNDGEKEVKSKTERKSPPHPYKKPSQASFPSKNKKEAEVEVFTSTSLVNLVKIMHSYCLKLHVEEKGDEMSRNHTLFSQEEVWKYERPSEESDEEINVVSDDEGTVMETKEEREGDRESDNSKVLKSVLVNGSTSREKKRVSFGPVQVASFDESVEKGLNGKNGGHTSKSVSVQLNSTKALKDLTSSAPEPQTISSEMNSNKTKPLPPKGETKAKSLSLQQYRQLRQKRQPLVEKQGNYTTKWPSVSEPPKELTPIFCLQGQRQNSCTPKTIYNYPEGRRGGAHQLHRSQTPGYKTHRNSAAPRPPPSEATPSTPLLHTGAKRPRTESKIIPSAGLQPGIVAHVNVTEPGSKKSPVKKPTLLSSDPPNPVLLPLSVSQTSPPSTDHCSTESNMEIFNRGSNLDSTMHFQEIQNESSGTSLQQQPSSLGLKPEESLVNQDCTPLLQEINIGFRNIASEVSSGSPAPFPTSTQTEPSSQPQKCSMILAKEAKLEPKTALSQSPETSGQTMCPCSSTPHLSQLFAPEPQETLPHVLPSASLPEEPVQSGFRGQSSTSDSGIEASDLTSLLEQFEETQAKEKRVQPKLVSSTSPSRQTGGHLDRTESAGTEGSTTIPLTFLVEPPKPLSTSESRGTQEILRDLQHLQMSEGANIPEPLGTEIVLSTQQDLPARRKNPPSKAIQIIEARPLPSKKTHSNLSEFPVALSSPHIYSSISSDHDYCEPADRSLTSITQSSRACNSQDFSETTDDLQGISYESSAASECRKQTPSTEVNPPTRAVDNSAKSVTQHLCEGPRSSSETASSADRVLSLSDSTAPEQDCGFAAKEKTAPCALPTPPPSPPVRGRDRRRDQRRSPRSDSSSSSCSSLSSSSSSSSASHSPKRQKRHHKRSESRSCSLSPPRSISHSPPRHYRWSYSRSRCSRSRSRSWSQSRSPSRSRSPSPQICHRQWRKAHRESRRLRREHEIRIQKLKAIDERRVVYVGRICRSMTHNELRERFSQFGEVECVSLHFRERGDHYGFVTFYDMNDAFAAIDNGSKLRRPDELPFDLCFGGRRQFCNSDYADLDANRDADSSPARSRFEELDFDQLLKQAQRGLKR